MQSVSEWLEPVKDRIFYKVVSNRLIYNTCWEDPRIDRRLLQLNGESRVVMLTSAGDNALAYLLDDPKKIYTVDSNPAQTALMDFKKTLIANGNHDQLWCFFGEGNCTDANNIYRSLVRYDLPEESRDWWDRHIHFFEPGTHPPSFYYRGTAGLMAWFIRRRIQRLGLYGEVLQLIDSRSIDEQKKQFYAIEDRLWNHFWKWLLNRDATMTMLGVPQTQKDMINREQKDGLPGFIRDALRNVFAQRSLKDNYFWRVYLTGRYTRNCCPDYLQEQHFDQLKHSVKRLSASTNTLIEFLETHEEPVSHFVLLDHQDWMADKQYDELCHEWNLILQRSRPGTRILFRSAGSTARFLPEFVQKHLTFHPDLTKPLHEQDRVGTYGSTHLAIVN